MLADINAIVDRVPNVALKCPWNRKTAVGVMYMFCSAIPTGLSPPDGRDENCFAACSGLGLSLDPGRWLVICTPLSLELFQGKVHCT